ncbi:MAG: chromosome partitioning protein ParB [Solirubrobacterales bacterium]
MAPDTGFPTQDAQADFSRARRRQALSRLARRLRREPDDVNLILPFDEVVEALGRRGEQRLGQQTIPLDSIVGTVDRAREFDRRFRPTSRRVRRRWQGIAEAMRRGQSMPPIRVYRIGDLHFVEDGHHRVSVARQLGLELIDAYVTEIVTEVGAGPETLPRDLPLKSHERLFFERVPLPPEARARIQLADEWRYATLAEGIEAWGFRLMQERGEFMTREQVARAWFEEEYLPVVETMREAGLFGRGTEAEAYTRVVSLRYLILRTHEWSDDVVERLRAELERPPRRSDDTMEHRLRRELR